MKPRTKLKPKKAPTQARSRGTVEAILQAATYILVEDGYGRLTTNRIADRAGVNIATLYQYFPNKESIFAELARRHVTEARASALAVLASVRGKGLEATVRAMVDMAIAAHRVQPALHRIFTEEMPRLGLGRLEAPSDLALQRESAAWLEESRASIEEPELALWMVDTAVHAIVHQAIVERPDDLARPVFAAELTRLVTRFLRRPPLARPKPRAERRGT